MVLRRLGVSALLLVCATAFGAGGRHREKGVAASRSLLLSYEVTNDRDSVHEVWFVDGEGRTFEFSRVGADPLAQALRAGAVTSRDVTLLLGESRLSGNVLSKGEVERVQGLVAAAEHSMLWTHRRKDPCKFGVNVTIRGYLFAKNRPASLVPLRETSCGWLVDENLSPEAQELLEWVYRLSGKPRPRLRR